MSIFIVSMPVAGLMERPPESNVIPLPTRARNPSASVGGRQVISTNRGGCVEPRLTPRSPPSPASTISSRSQTWISKAAPSVPSVARRHRPGRRSELLRGQRPARLVDQIPREAHGPRHRRAEPQRLTHLPPGCRRPRASAGSWARDRSCRRRSRRRPAGSPRRVPGLRRRGHRRRERRRGATRPASDAAAPPVPAPPRSRITAGVTSRGGPHPDNGHGAAVASRHHLHLACLALETETAQQPPVQIVRLRVHLIGANADGDHIGPGRNGSGEGHGNGHGGSSWVSGAGANSR